MKTGALANSIKAAQAIPDPTASPEFDTLRALRRKLGSGGLPTLRTPEDDARISTFRVLRELLDLLAEFTRRVRRGDRVRLVSREQPSTPGRMVIDIIIETTE